MEIDSHTQAVIDEIRRAFRGVKLGDGIGLSEADAIDNCAHFETQAALRASDEKDDWEKIPWEKLDRFFCSPGFLDAAGMRFHLPAFMIAELMGAFDDIALRLTHLTDYKREQFGLLNPPQRQAVRSFLLYLCGNPDFVYDAGDLAQALAEYWLAV